MDIRNVNDLAKFLNTPKGQQMIFGDKNVRSALKEAADLLYELLHEQLEAFYRSYEPTTYTRTYGLLNSLRISPIEQLGNELSISVYFDPDMATHPSIFDGEDGYTAILMNEGFEWRNNVGIYHLSYYPGFHFVEKAITEFNTRNRWGFMIRKEGEHNGQKI